MRIAGAAAKAGRGLERRVRLDPAWLRPSAIILVLSVHAGVLAGAGWWTSAQITPLPDIEVQLVPQGETVTETSSVPTPDAAPIVSPEAPALASPDITVQEQADIPQPTIPSEQATSPPELVAPLPQVEAQDAPPLPVEQPRTEQPEKPKPVSAKPRKKPRDIKKLQEQQRAALRALQKARQEIHARQLAARPQLGAPAIRAGAREGSSEATHMSLSAYGALVSAEINRHKIYPDSARNAGATGVVDVLFTIGPSGAIVSHTITRSSGNAAIDAAVHSMMAAAHPPPPPGGHFLGSVDIHFDLDR